MAPTEHKAQRNGREYTVRIFDSSNACTFDQPINSKTGKGWQASKNHQNFFGDNAKAKAMVHWLKQQRN